MLLSIKNLSQTGYYNCHKKQSYLTVSNSIALKKDEFNFTGSTKKAKDAEKIAQKIINDNKIHDRKLSSEVTRLVNLGIDTYYIGLMLNTLSKKRFLELSNMLKNGLSENYISDYVALDDNKAARMKELFDIGITSGFSPYINIDDEDRYSRFKNLASTKAIKTYLKQNDIEDENSMADTILTDIKGVCISDNKKQYSKLMNILNNENIVKLEKGGHVGTYTLGSLITLHDDDLSNYCSKLFSNDNFVTAVQKSRFSDQNMSSIIVSFDISLDKVLKLFSDDSLKHMFEKVSVSIDDLKFISQLDDEIFKKISRVAKNTGVQELIDSMKLKIRNIIELTQLSEDELNGIEELLNIDYDKMIRLMKQTGIVNAVQYKDKINYKELFKHIDDEYVISMEKLQNDSGARIIAKKQINSEDNSKDIYYYGDDFQVKVLKIVCADDKGNITKSTTERKGTFCRAWYTDSKRTLFLESDSHRREIISQMEIVNDENNEPEYIIYSKRSDKLQGVYETTKYNLKDYPQDMDVIKAIQDGTIEGGEKISHVETFDIGNIRYVENYAYGDTNTQRSYFLKTDKKGKVQSCVYRYKITDKDNNSLLSLNRYWEKNSDRITTTVINGKIYRAIFNDEDMTVIIYQQNGDCEVFNIGNKLSNNDYSNKIKFFDFLKTVPADKILLLGSHISALTITKPMDSCIIAGDNIKLYTGLDLAIMSHELCHAAEFDGSELHCTSGKISKNQELIDIYNKEMKEFNRHYPQICQSVIKYFNQAGGGGGGIVSTGLAEFVAETSMLLTTYGNISEGVRSRAQYLVRYFPETIAKIAQLLQEHMIF